MTEFVASNGWKIRLTEKSGAAMIDVYGGSGGMVLNLLASQLFAVREFFQHERDIELGRWRSKGHPEYVVYPQDEENYGVIVVDESGSCNSDYVSVNMAAGSSPAPRVIEVAREFFAAHPEPKPWHNANDGEVWALGLAGGYHAASVAVTGGKFVHGVKGDVRVWELTDPGIDYGKRIWPEVSE